MRREETESRGRNRPTVKDGKRGSGKRRPDAIAPVSRFLILTPIFGKICQSGSWYDVFLFSRDKALYRSVGRLVRPPV